MIHLGFGRHVETVETDKLFESLRTLYAVYFLCDFALYLTKTSAPFFLRVFPRYANFKWFNTTLIAVNVVNTA